MSDEDVRAELDELNRREPRAAKRAREEAVAEESRVKTEGAGSAIIVKIEESQIDEDNINWEE